MYIELQTKKVSVLDLKGNQLEEIELPLFFSYPVRKDLIRRVFLSEFTKSLQPKGRDPLAGKRTSALSFGINLGIARVPRVKGSGEAALAPNTVGGRLAFPPTTEKRLVEEVNLKEKKLGIISALAATADPNFVKARGHRFTSNNVPIILVDDFENISKAKEIMDILKSIGVVDDIKRVKESKGVRAGKGKMRGRRYQIAKGPLIVVSNHKSPVVESASNIPGVNVVSANLVSVIHLAPGGHPGRLTIYTKSSINILRQRFEGRLNL
ncbi:50S ribosomal protein L4 [Sulfolobus acidocaldarius]|uniref:Large ribosomal subunit protein uL4 n=5 Tax=Sulfolobus acidocaldarius TaxID=2285 RepID=RL4_SULAC|nr:50S ribosomal protein L4 [Sulfolobus acidocaldarius]Q4JB41.1 RecName: Full=Large ribosomal subunit protein uL4; AltName: Full=50S ribosomal protein L4 [Sulfolobus acidocaldarius DSM 639]AAY79988.1 50S ribosomal protein L4E [Sulfolobus acidocaldarius DSM 639]AGE70557.1 50S ribosomal protein L4P [Sulfolobus acidocaldarius N8]AGE72830.1 50S ribosomal protein L4P [Sulfolobus acidocaldarius Ron12/I]ALU29084.1 50S ribosomal protein L4 [Sulfolobus acidocaldarius]ALU31810.1 50S ribosomal protein L